jgi:hypothetical protein
MSKKILLDEQHHEIIDYLHFIILFIYTAFNIWARTSLVKVLLSASWPVLHCVLVIHLSRVETRETPLQLPPIVTYRLPSTVVNLPIDF